MRIRLCNKNIILKLKTTSTPEYKRKRAIYSKEYNQREEVKLKNKSLKNEFLLQ